MGVEFLQSNLTSGELTPELHARTELQAYQNGVAEAKNMVIMPLGGLKRRPGLSKIQDSEQNTSVRLEPFVFDSNTSYLLVFKPLSVNILKDGVLQSTEVTPYTNGQITEIDVIQSGDTVIITHPDHPVQRLQRQGSDTNWDFSPLSFDRVPYDNFGNSINEKYINHGGNQIVPLSVGDIILNRDGNSVNGLDYTYYTSLTTGSNINLATQDYSNTSFWTLLATQEPVWSATRGYPTTCTFFGGRLYFAGTKERPTTIWGSRINGFFNFDIGDASDDLAIEDTLDSDQFNAIERIFSGRNLQVFTAGGEFYNRAQPITPASSSWSKQSGYGSRKIKPVSIDGATLFVDSSKRTVRQFIYNFNEDSYNSIEVSLLSSHLLKDVVSIASISGNTNDLSQYLYAINSDGTVAVFNTLRNQNINGWTSWTTQGLFKDVTVVDKKVYFAVERKGVIFIEEINNETYTDHNVVTIQTPPTFYNIVHQGDNVVVGSNNLIYTDVSSGTGTTQLQTNYSQTFLNTPFKVIADFSIFPEQTPTGTANNNTITIDRTAYRLECGLDYDVNIRTLPLATTTQIGNTLHRRKRVVKVNINLLESLGVYARDRFSADRKFTVILDQAPQLFTGFKELYLLGYNRLQEIEISQKDPLPFNVRAIGYEVEY